jgi:hypothetical protein
LGLLPRCLPRRAGGARLTDRLQEGAFVDPSNGHVWIDDDKGTHLWENVDPDRAYAYYADQNRRADFPPKFALGMIGGGASFATRGALGMAGGRLIQPARNAQIHHAISAVVHRALDEHPLLAGYFKLRDPRFEAKAINLDAHHGWQDWHRAPDKEVAARVRDNPLMTPSAFEDYLHERYNKPDLQWRFRDGFHNRRR